MPYCAKCGKQVNMEDKFCPNCGTPPIKDDIVSSKDNFAQVSGNTSGQGTSAVIPGEISEWNWGAFFLNWIWGIGNNVWIALIALMPFAGLIMSIVLGVKGSEWAWQSKKWDSIEHFRETQKKWAFWGLILFILPFALFTFFSMMCIGTISFSS
jgi:hypothetical protein